MTNSLSWHTPSQQEGALITLRGLLFVHLEQIICITAAKVTYIDRGMMGTVPE